VDLFTFLFILALLFLLGYHSVPKEEYRWETVAVYITPERIGGSPEFDTDISVDSRYGILSLSKSEGEYIMVCSVMLHEKGYMLSGGKFLAANQRISLTGEVSHLEGRIRDIGAVSRSRP
jgi:hypothetical protein